MNQKHALLKAVLPYVWITLACPIYALGFNWFYVPNQIAYGGVTGISQMVNAAFGWPSIGVLIIAFNVPLFLFGWRLLGGKLLVTSLFAMILSAVLIDLLAAVYTFPTMEPLLACIYSGVTIGFSLGVIFLQGATTGGTDIAARLLKLKLEWLPIGRIILILDLVVIVSTAIVCQTGDRAHYGVVALYISTLTIDGVLYGMDTAKVAYIISDQFEEIASTITKDLHRGVTILQGEGSWTGTQRKVLLCAFKRRQIVELKRTVKELDPDAFLIVCEAHEVLGYGFRNYKKNDL